MKKIYFTLLLSLIAIIIFAQANFNKYGLVREQNSGKKPVPNVQLIFSNAAPTASDSAGKFRLVFTNQKANDVAFSAEIAKRGYDLVNDKDIERVKLSRDTQLRVDIIVAKTGTIEAAQKTYYAVLDNCLSVGLRNEKEQLRLNFQRKTLSKQAYDDQYDLLQRQYNHQKKQLNRLSEKFAKVNFDDVSPRYQEFLELIKKGKMEEVADRLERAGLLYHISTSITAAQSIKSGADSVKQRRTIDSSVTEDLALLGLQAELHVMALNLSKAEAIYDQLLFFDETHLDILRGGADFYKTNQYYEKAINLYPKIIAHPQIEVIQKYQAYIDGSDALAAMGQLEDALGALMQAKNMAAQWFKEHPNTPFSKHALANIYLKLGNLETTLGEIDKAVIFYKSANRFAQELTDMYPTNKAFKNTLAASFEKQGKIHVKIGELSKTLQFYETNLQLRKELMVGDANNLEQKYNWATAYENMGNAHTSLNNSDKALPFYEQHLALINELHIDDNFETDIKNNLANAHAKLGMTYTTLGNLEKGLKAFTTYNRLSKELNTEIPSNAHYKNGWSMSCSKLAEIHIAMGNMDKAVIFYEERLMINQELCTAYPNNVSYKNNLAVAYGKLGSLYTAMDELDRALPYYEKDIEVSKELYTSYPKNSYFKSGLALSYSKLGTFYKDKKNDKAKAHFYFEQCKALYSELVTSAPTSMDYKNNLKWVEEKLSEK
jgi:tetratricopeptide (TPR) repeat protein